MIGWRRPKIRFEERALSVCNEVVQRPAIGLALGLICGLLAPLWLVCLAGAITAGVGILKGRNGLFWVSAAAGLIVGLVRAPLPPQMVELSSSVSGDLTLSGPVVRGKQSNFAEGWLNGDRVRISMHRDTSIIFGTEYRVTGRLAPPPPDQFDSYRRRSLVGTLYLHRADPVRSSPLAVFSRAARQIQLAFLTVSERLAPDAKTLILSIGLNDTSELSADDRDVLARTGTIHIISTSGMHIALLGAAILAIVRPLPIPRWAQVVLMLLLLGVFVLAAGARPPAMRSWIMTAILALGPIFKRQSDLLSALLVALCVQLVWRPYDIVDPGLILSFAAVLGLSLFNTTSTGETLLQKAMNGLKSSLIATLMTSPFAYLAFGGMSLIGPIANLIVAPIVPLILILSLVAVVLDQAAGISSFDPILNVAGTLLIAPMRWLAHMGSVSVSSQAVVPLWLVIALYALIVMAWQPQRRKWRTEGADHSEPSATSHGPKSMS